MNVLFFMFFLVFIIITKNDFLFCNFFFFDDFSKMFLWLNFVIFLLCYNLIQSKLQNFLTMMIFFFSLFFFMSNNLILLFFSFETILLPIMLMGMLWGYQKERLESMIFMMMFTLIFSMPSLYNLLNFIMLSNNMNMMMNNMYMMPEMKKFMILMGFLVKMPIFMLHLWLPKAHVESPTIGSMQLAGVLLKLGSYGLIRFIMFFNLYFNMYIIFIFMFMCLLSMNISFKQMDLKMLIAYNSISHMNIMFIMIISLSMMSKDVSSMMSITHGMTASMLFFFIGDMYLNIKNRIIFMSQGYLHMYMMDLFMFLFSIYSNLGVPPMFSFMPEMYIFSLLYIKENIFFFFLFFFFL